MLGVLRKYLFVQNEVEFLVIDSSDGSISLPPEIRMFRTINKGPSSARNIGAQKAEGEWLMFCDADDIISPFVFRYLDQISLLNADAIFFPYQRVENECFEIETSKFYQHIELPETLSLIRIKKSLKFLEKFYPVHSVLLRKKIFEKVCFFESQWFIEDVRFYLEMSLISGVKIFQCSDYSLASFHREFKAKTSLSGSNDEAFWDGVCDNYDFVVNNMHIGFIDKVKLVKLVLINYHVVDQKLRRGLTYRNSKIWSFFFGIPYLFRFQFLYAILLAGNKLKNMLKKTFFLGL